MRALHIRQNYFGMIVSGRKTLEIRAAYYENQSISEGEKIRLMSDDKANAVVTVKGVRRYSNFDEMLGSEDPTRIVPDIPQDGVARLLRQIYPPEREQLGVVVLDIEVDASDPPNK